MQVKLKDVLHMYVEAIIELSTGEKGMILSVIPGLGTLTLQPVNGEMRNISLQYAAMGKLILRPLTDMTEKEAQYIYNHHSCRTVDMPMNHRLFMIEVAKRLTEQSWLFLYLLQKGFDFFDLISTGQAIDKTKR